MFKNIKFNKLSAYVTVKALTYDIVSHDAKEYPAAGGLHNIINNIDFKINWDADHTLNNTLNPGTMFDDRTFKNIKVNGKKPAKFTWTVPPILRNYYDCHSVKSVIDNSQGYGVFFKSLVDANALRMPTVFMGGISNQLDDIGLPFIEPLKPQVPNIGTLPIKFLVNIKWYLSVTFKGANQL